MAPELHQAARPRGSAGTAHPPIIPRALQATGRTATAHPEAAAAEVIQADIPAAEADIPAAEVSPAVEASPVEMQVEEDPTAVVEEDND